MQQRSAKQQRWGKLAVWGVGLTLAAVMFFAPGSAAAASGETSCNSLGQDLCTISRPNGGGSATYCYDSSSSCSKPSSCSSRTDCGASSCGDSTFGKNSALCSNDSCGSAQVDAQTAAGVSVKGSTAGSNKCTTYSFDWAGLLSLLNDYCGSQYAAGGNAPALNNNGLTVNATQPQQNSSAAANASEASDYVQAVVDLVNAERTAAGLKALTLDAGLTAAAQTRAEECTEYFSHTRPDGSSCFTVLAEQNVSYTTAGENLAIGQLTPQQVVSEWLASPGHRANIMNAAFTRIGVGVTAAGGAYAGYAWAQCFAD